MNKTRFPQAATSPGDAGWMERALEQAKLAKARGEVPVGAVVIGADGQLLAEAGNAPCATHDPTAHAEVAALRLAGAALRNYRMPGCTLFVTLEPCPMCMSAIAMARISRVVYGASDERLGACGGALNLAADSRLNAHTVVEGGLMASQSVALLQGFFRDRRPDRQSRLLRIERLEDLPNVDPTLVLWLQNQGVTGPAMLADTSVDERWAGWLRDSVGDPWRHARLMALRHFVQGGDARSWRTWLTASPTDT